MKNILLLFGLFFLCSNFVFAQNEYNSFYSGETSPEFLDPKKIQSKEQINNSKTNYVNESGFSSLIKNESGKYEFALFNTPEQPVSYKKSMAGIVFLNKEKFKNLGLNVILGGSQIVFNQNFNVLISDRMAKILFGEKNPIDEVLIWNEKYSVVIKGVFQVQQVDFPLEFDFVSGTSTLDKINLKLSK